MGKDLTKESKCEHIWIDATKEVTKSSWRWYVDIRVCLKCSKVRGK